MTRAGLATTPPSGQRMPTVGRRRGATATASAQLTLLRGFALSADGIEVRVPLSAQRVLALLALHARPLARVFVAGNLWIDSTESHAAAALRTALWRIAPPAHGIVHADGATLSLDPALEVDLARESRRAQALLDAGDAPLGPGDLPALRDAGDLLPDWYDDWVIVERERFRQLRLHALEALCRRLLDAGRHAEAAQAGLAAVVAEPLRESAHRGLIAVHLAEGNAGEALRQYALCRDLLARQLGAAPSPALEAQLAGLQHQP